MKVALAQVVHPRSFDEGLANVLSAVAAAADLGAVIVCFPECVLKGMRGEGFPIEALVPHEVDVALERVSSAAASHRIHVILPTERPHGEAWQNGAYVISRSGAIEGYQTKNQLPPEEEPLFVPGTERQIFEVLGVPFGVAICHEGWRYPETVRWSATRGAKIVFHASFCGGPGEPGPSSPWGGTFYEKAMACRAGENHVWFASVNFALPNQECRTSVVAPDGRCVVSAPLHEAALLVCEVDTSQASGFLAQRLAPERYRETRQRS